MSKYGEIAVKAANLSQQTGLKPRVAWMNCAAEAYPNSESSQNKNCPRATFLGLAEEGLIKEIPPGDYVNSPDNKQHGLDAVEILRGDSSMAEDPKELWNSLPGVDKAYNEQMHVVIALWEAGLIKK
jgi:hypothetical protein